MIHNIQHIMLQRTGIKSARKCANFLLLNTVVAAVRAALRCLPGGRLKRLQKSVFGREESCDK